MVGGRLLIGKTSVWLRVQTKNNFVFQASLTFFPNLHTMGVSNITADFNFIFFADFDRISEEDLNAQLRSLNGKYGLSHFLILESSPKKYNVINFERFELNEFQTILNNTLCDYTYKNIPPKLDKGWIVRIFPKYDMDGKEIQRRPIFHKFINCNNKSTRKLSRSHIELFDKLFHLRDDIGFMSFLNNNKNMLDDFEKVKILAYGTSNKNLLTNLDDDHLVCHRLNIEWVNDK